MVLYLGIDEAGRGAVIGPLVMAGVEATKDEISKLQELNVRDSKKISKSRRERLYDLIKENVTNIYVEIAYPREIDDWVFNRNLNLLEEKMARKIIIKSSASVVIIDSFSANAISLATKFQHFFKNKKIIVEHKADNNYVIVGAASIIAKVVRDRSIKELGNDIGSGYPSDPITQKFLDKNINNEKVMKYVRHSWETVERMKKRAKQRKLFL